MRRSWRLLLTLVGLVGAFLIIRHSDPAQLLTVVSTRGWILLLILPLWGIVYCCNAVAWWLLIDPEGPPMPKLLAVTTTVGAFGLNYATPFMSLGGEPYKVAEAASWVGQRRALGSVVAFRLLHALSHVLVMLLACVLALFVFPRTWPFLTGIALAALILGVVAFFLMARHRDGVFDAVRALVGRVPGLSRLGRWLGERQKTLEELDHYVTVVYARGPRRFALALAVELVGRLLATMEFFVILAALGYSDDPLAGFVAANFSSLVINTLAFIPFELGTKEGGLAIVMSWLGLGAVVGVHAALVSRVREVFWMVCGMAIVALLRQSPVSAEPERPLS